MRRAAALVAVAAFGACVPSEEEAAPEVPQPAWPRPQPTWTPSAGAAPIAWLERGGASFYSDRLAGHRTFSGERYDPGAFTAAHRTLPMGTIIDVVRMDGRAVRVRVNDRGPHVAGRVVDLSRRAAEALGMTREGVVDVAIRVVSAR